MPTHTPHIVLVVEGNAPIARLLEMVLERQGGYSVLGATTGDAAALVLRATAGGMVLVFDTTLPDMDGEAFLALAEQEHWLPDRIACVCITGTRRQDLPATFEALLTRYDIPVLMKPFALDELLAAVRQVEQRIAHLPASSASSSAMPPATPLDHAAGQE